MVVVKSVMKTVVQMVISSISWEIMRGMTIKYLKCRADLNFEADFRVNGVISTIVTKWDLMLFGLPVWLILIYNIFIF